MMPDAALGLHCPEGGQFHLCPDSKVHFLGCCLYDPCEDGSGLCRTDALRKTGYNLTNKDLIWPQQCEISHDSENRTMHWWRCERSKPPYFSCCSRNTCFEGQGCPPEYLAAAVLSDDPVAAAPFLGNEIPAGASGTDGCSLGENATNSGVVTNKNNMYRSIEIGIPVAAGVVLILALCIYYFFAKRKKADNRVEQAGADSPGIEGRGMFTTRSASAATSTAFMNPRPAPTPTPMSTPRGLLTPQPLRQPYYPELNLDQRAPSTAGKMATSNGSQWSLPMRSPLRPGA
ncbi:hypothetical protein GGR50DRAFT_696325 [Xylaria sp. CBS 124048]|nr:hypothetical protein GGR50DRAFT_696325 [Xylaria sp. CBS 124048]